MFEVKSVFTLQIYSTNCYLIFLIVSVNFFHNFLDSDLLIRIVPRFHSNNTRQLYHEVLDFIFSILDYAIVYRSEAAKVKLFHVFLIVRYIKHTVDHALL